MGGLACDGGGAAVGVLAILMYLLLGAAVLGFFWWRARATRRRFTCPDCGEVIVVEQMSAKRCPTCGNALGPGRDA